MSPHTSRRTHDHIAVARGLEPREITQLAESYRAWRDVLAAAVDALHTRRGSVDAALARDLHHVLSEAAAWVPATDLEDAAMALWLFACANQVDVPDATTDLMREPYREFEAARTPRVPTAA